MRVVAALLFVALCGCATQEVSAYVPFVPKAEMHNQIAFAFDLTACRAYALEYLGQRASFDATRVAEAGTKGALGNLASVAINPLATGLSGVGSASSELTSELGLNGAEGRRIVAICMHDKGRRSGAYAVMAPEL